MNRSDALVLVLVAVLTILVASEIADFGALLEGVEW